MEIKVKDYRCGPNYALSKLVLDNGIYGEGKIQIPLISTTTIDSLAHDPG